MGSSITSEQFFAKLEGSYASLQDLRQRLNALAATEHLRDFPPHFDMEAYLDWAMELGWVFVTKQTVVVEIAPKIEPGLYQHYKGGFYRVLGVARDTESGAIVVVYMPTDNRAVPAMMVRPAKMFLEELEVDGVLRPRFQIQQPRI